MSQSIIYLFKEIYNRGANLIASLAFSCQNISSCILKFLFLCFFTNAFTSIFYIICFSDDYTIPAGCNVVIPIKLVHTLPEYWKTPNQFNPDRFLNKEEANLPKCAYMPFSYGPRNCIGLIFVF